MWQTAESEKLLFLDQSLMVFFFLFFFFQFHFFHINRGKKMFPSMNSRPNFTSQNVTKHPAKLSTLVPIFPILFCYPHFSIRTFPSAFFHPHFSIRIFPSAIRHPPSAAIRSVLYRDPKRKTQNYPSRFLFQIKN